MVTTPLEWKPATSAPGAADERDPDIVQLTNGNYLVVWSGTDDSGAGSPNGSDILGQIYSPTGNTMLVSAHVV